MTKTIYNTFVPMENQEQCDRLKKVCLDNALPVWTHQIAFFMDKSRGYYSVFIYRDNCFLIAAFELNNKIQNRLKVTESEFMKLLEEHIKNRLGNFGQCQCG